MNNNIEYDAKARSWKQNVYRNYKLLENSNRRISQPATLIMCAKEHETLGAGGYIEDCTEHLYCRLELCVVCYLYVHKNRPLTETEKKRKQALETVLQHAL